ncbi:MAG: sialate O-acetylesterase [Planctomycetota bacterium]
MKRLRLVCGVMILGGILPAAIRADVRLPKIFTDNMMFQREAPVRVWGWAAPGEAVKVALAGKEAAAQADAQGRWAVEFPAVKEGEGLELTVTGGNTITLKNLIVGDIWLCSGQSNMEMALKGCVGAAEDIKAADLSGIRRIKFQHVTSAYPEDDAPAATPWQACTPQTAGGFTAVGFYFAREIHQRTGVPIGILDDNWGGTAIEPWTPPEGLELVPELAGALADRRKAVAHHQAVELPKALDALERWIAETRAALPQGARLPPAPALPAHPAASGWGAMYNAMIHPLVRLPIKGALWYQGESNGSEGAGYGDKMRALVGGWRRIWGQGDFPFYFVQLANYQNPNENPAGGDGWARVRAAQTRALAIPNTGMAVIIDIGEAGDIHPRNKYDVGSRLARWAMARDYGRKDVTVVSGPLFREMKVEGDTIRLHFDHVGSGLMVGRKDGRAPAVENKEGKLRRFAIAGADKGWQWADAVIDGETVVVSSPKVKGPAAVRYAFSMNPDGANLYNREGLPASPFRTDNW